MTFKSIVVKGNHHIYGQGKIFDIDIVNAFWDYMDYIHFYISSYFMCRLRRLQNSSVFVDCCMFPKGVYKSDPAAVLPAP